MHCLHWFLLFTFSSFRLFLSWWSCLRASRNSLFKGFGACGLPANHFLKDLLLAGFPQLTFKWFDACGPPANHSVKGLVFPRMAKVISQMVWCFRAWRKSFPEGFGISAHGESHFPKGLVFPRLAKIISRMVWCFRAWRKSFPEWFGISALGESHFPKG